MKKITLIGIVIGFIAIAFGVSYFSDVGTTKKKECSSVYLPDYKVSDLLAVMPDEIVEYIEDRGAPFSITPVGKVNTKGLVQPFRYPLKLC